MRSIATFASKLADLVSRYTLEVRTSKDPFVLATFLDVIHEATTDIKSQNKSLLGVQVVINNLSRALTTALASAQDPENIIKGLYEAPWVARSAELHALAARDEDAERKVIKLTEEVKDLAREIRLKDQGMQESSVRIELMEKRMESVKKQADAMAELEGELSKIRKQEKDYEAAIEQLQGDLDALEQQNAKLKQAAPAERGGKIGLY